MEIKIGIADTGRELVIASESAPEEIASIVSAALSGGDDGMVDLLDDQGRRYLVPVRRIGYVEIGATDGRRVGFGL